MSARVQVRKMYSEEVAKNSTVEYSYTVPAGKSLSIISVWGGHEHSTREVRTEIEIDGSPYFVFYGHDALFPVRETFPENTVVKVRLVNNDPHNLHLTGGWKGYTVG